MLNVPTYSQRDKRWASKKLGFSNYTIGGYGCTLTCLSALITHVTGTEHTPDKVNAQLKTLGNYSRTNPKGAFLGALLVWANVQRVYPQLRFVGRNWNYNNWAVWSNINIHKMPTMVEVNGAKIGAPRHWVLFIGSQKMLDPWTGRIESTSKYPLTGSSIYRKN